MANSPSKYCIDFKGNPETQQVETVKTIVMIGYNKTQIG
jgi:hypothetical protein